jgi:hypothetical protein
MKSRICLALTVQQVRLLACAAVCTALAGGAAAEEAGNRPQQTAPESAVLMPKPTTAEIDDTLAIGGENIAARKVRSRMTVPVQINGSGPYRFVVDSGADTSVVGLRLADALGLPARGHVLLNGMTENRYVDRVGIAKVDLGSTSVEGLYLPALREADIGADGMIGLDALVRQRLVLDFEKRTIAIDDATKPIRTQRDTEIVVTARLKKGQLILTQVTAGRTRLDAVVDTGSEITIGNTALRNKLWRHYRGKIEKVEVTGVTGVTTTLDLMRVPELKLGSIILQDVPIAFADVPPFHVFGIDQQPALLLGTDLMESFRKVSLDFRARKVRFQLKRCEMQNLSITTGGEYASRIGTESASVCAR